MKKSLKIATTLFLLLLVFAPITIFLIYPVYSELVVRFEKIKTYNLAKKTTVTIFSSISPSRSKYSEQILGTSTIEESIANTEMQIKKHDLEDINSILNIPSLNISGKIFQGKDSSTMDKGFWHFPISKKPGEQGNVVIIGHRFLHMPPKTDTFFNLDKIDIGEKIQVVSDVSEHNYIVLEKKEVQPNDMSIIQDSDEYTLTLVTCTPLWTSEKRLVIIAKLDKLYKKV
ncbi:MAG: sortase [Candidatus Dojkabacteria bacterium]|jgi:sortase A